MLYWIMLVAAQNAVILWLVARVMRRSSKNRELALLAAEWEEHANAVNRQCAAQAIRAARALKALRKIRAQETPGANATVKRMAKIAREALS